MHYYNGAYSYYNATQMIEILSVWCACVYALNKITSSHEFMHNLNQFVTQHVV